MVTNPGEFAIHNDTADDMPAGALAEWSGGFTSRGAMKVVKPTAADMVGLVVAGPFSIPAGGDGIGSFNPRALVAFDPEGDQPVQGDTIGSAAGNWYGTVGGSGFRVFGAASGPWCGCVRADVDTLGGVQGPENSRDNSIVLWDGTTGELIKDNNYWKIASGNIQYETGGVGSGGETPVTLSYGQLQIKQLASAGDGSISISPHLFDASTTDSPGIYASTISGAIYGGLIGFVLGDWWVFGGDRDGYGGAGTYGDFVLGDRYVGSGLHSAYAITRYTGSGSGISMTKQRGVDYSFAGIGVVGGIIVSGAFTGLTDPGDGIAGGTYD